MRKKSDAWFQSHCESDNFLISFWLDVGRFMVLVDSGVKQLRSIKIIDNFKFKKTLPWRELENVGFQLFFRFSFNSVKGNKRTEQGNPLPAQEASTGIPSFCLCRVGNPRRRLIACFCRRSPARSLTRIDLLELTKYLLKV